MRFWRKIFGTRQPDKRAGWLVAGLGNPGQQYEDTRHNFGYLAADGLIRYFGGRWSSMKGGEALVAETRLADTEPMRFLKPRTFMNRSGMVVARELGRLGMETGRLIVLLDDMALPLGMMRIREGGGDGGHNGLRSIIGEVGKRNFIRLRLGIAPLSGTMPPSSDWSDYVLARFNTKEMNLVREMVSRTAEAVETIIKDGVHDAMNLYNRSNRGSETRD